MGYQVNPYINGLGLAHKTVKGLLAYDIEKYDVPVDKSLYKNYQQYDIVFFMISRHMWKELYADFKGNDKFINAFAKFVKEYKPNVKLILIRKGTDYKASEKLVNSHGIEDYVEWIDMINKDGIRAYLSLPNCVVVDQFWHDEWYKRYPSDKARPKIGFGGGSIEAMAARRPLITVFFDEAFYENSMPPVLYAFKTEEIYQRIVQVYKMTPEEKDQMGENGRQFVYKWHAWYNAIDVYINTLKKVLAEVENNHNI